MKRRAILKYMHFGWQLLGGMALLTGLGYWADKRFGSRWGIVCGLLTGVAYGAVLVWGLIQDANND